MKSHYSISIPKPCHEDWSKMTPNEKGKFCQSCSKTVVDFTKMNTEGIQDYLHKNRHQRICGHIRQSQLDTINLKIPETVFNQSLNFHRLFLLALMFSMGVTLFNCEDEKGVTKKIESVEIINNTVKQKDSISEDKKQRIDSTNSKKKVTEKANETKIEKEISPRVIDGLIIVGDIDFPEEKPVEIDSLNIEPVPHCPEPDEREIVLGLLVPESPAEFKDTPKDLSYSEKRKYLSKRVSEIVEDNFNQEIAHSLNLKGKQRIFTQFKVTEEGHVEDIKARASHSALEKEAIRVIKLLPQFKPAKQRDKTISAIYNLPIVFVIED